MFRKLVETDVDGRFFFRERRKFESTSATTGKRAQRLVFKIFLFQSAVFFFHVALMTANDAAAFPTSRFDMSERRSLHFFGQNSKNNKNNSVHLLPRFGAFRRRFSDKRHQRSGNFNLRKRPGSFYRTSFDDSSVYRDFTSCSNSVLRLSCPTPDATVFLLSLFPMPNDDAVRNPAACVTPVSSPPALPYSTRPPVDLTCQYFKNNVQTVRSRCKSRSSCTIRVDDLFDYSTPVKRSCTVIATFQCHPSPKMKNLPQYLRFCTKDQMRLTCADKQDWLVITTAVYDFRPPSGDKTCSSVKRNVYCNAPKTQSVIRSHCERKRSCKLFINGTTFGPIFRRSAITSRRMPVTTAPSVFRDKDADTCPGTEHFALYVYFMCVPKVILSPHPRTSLLAGKQETNGQTNTLSSSIELGRYDNSRLVVTTKPFTGKEDKELQAVATNSGSKSLLSTPAGGAIFIASSTTKGLLLTPGVSTPSPIPNQSLSSSVIEQRSPVFRVFSDWIFALDYIQRNPYPVIATASLGVCIGLLLGAIVLLVRLYCRLRAARCHSPRRSVGLQCEMYAGRPAVLVRSTASQTSSNTGSRPISGSGLNQAELAQQQHQQQQRMIAAAAASTTVTSNGGTLQQQTMQTAAMCAQSNSAQPPASSTLNPSLYAGPPAATAAGATRPLLALQQQQQHQHQPATGPVMSTSLGSANVGSQAGNAPLFGGSTRNYTYTPRLSVRWFQ